MSKSALKKALKDMSREGLEEVLLEVYDARPEAREYLEFWVNPDASKELESYKLKIFKIFFISEGRPRKSPGMADIRRTIKYFTTLCVDSESAADLMLYTLDVYRMWLETRRHVLTHRKRVDKLVEETSLYIESRGLDDRFGLRMERQNESLTALFDRGDKDSPRRWSRWHW